MPNNKVKIKIDGDDKEFREKMSGLGSAAEKGAKIISKAFVFVSKILLLKENLVSTILQVSIAHQLHYYLTNYVALILGSLVYSYRQ